MHCMGSVALIEIFSTCMINLQGTEKFTEPYKVLDSLKEIRSHQNKGWVVIP